MGSNIYKARRFFLRRTPLLPIYTDCSEQKALQVLQWEISALLAAAAAAAAAAVLTV